MLTLLVIGGNPVVSERAHTSGGVGIIDGHHPAFSRGNMFDRMEAECIELGQPSNRLALTLSTKGVARVGHDGDPRAACNLLDRSVVAWLPGVVDGNHGLGLRSDPGGNLRRIDQQGVWIHVGEYGARSLENDTVGSGRESHGRHYDLVSGTDVQGMHGAVQGSGPAGYGNGFGRPYVSGEGLFEGFNQRPGGQPVRTHRLDDGPDILLVDALMSVWGSQMRQDLLQVLARQPHSICV